LYTLLCITVIDPTEAFQILEFSGFWSYMQKNFNTDNINNKNYMLRYALSTNRSFEDVAEFKYLGQH
jgi:hypothetical protein